jgi:hypothetical protein
LEIKNEENPNVTRVFVCAACESEFFSFFLFFHVTLQIKITSYHFNFYQKSKWKGSWEVMAHVDRAQNTTLRFFL